MDLRAAAIDEAASRLRVVTYNIHKCQGFDRKISPQRIIDVMRELRADIYCLQEVVHSSSAAAHFDQAQEIARAFPEYAWAFGANRTLRGGQYGNMTLTRLPLLHWQNHNVSHGRRENRGVLRTDIQLGPAETLRLFNLHLGTGYLERRAQALLLSSPDVLGEAEPGKPRLLVGDFNEWTRGLTTRTLRQTFRTFRPQHGLRFPRTYPGMLPLLSLDHVYFESPLQIEDTRLWRTRKALVASDHLPLVADFNLSSAAQPAP
jgi:endonuclease/exonuclease/phosphatase family metal-dependent hydrolase